MMGYQTDNINMRTQTMETRRGGSPVSDNQVQTAYLTLVAGINKAYAGCRKGDMIRVPTMLNDIIASRCDMNKAVIPDGNAIMCVQK